MLHLRRYFDQAGGAGSTPPATPPAPAAGGQDTATPPADGDGARKPPPAPVATPPAQDAGDMSALPAWAQSLIGELRKENAGHRTKAKQAETAAEEAARKAAEEQGKFKELYEAAQAKGQAAEARAARLELEALKTAVAAKVGLPAQLAARLQGEDEAALEADARQLLAVLPKQTAGNDAQRGTGGTGGQAPQMTPEEIAEFAARMGIDPKFVKPEMFKLPAKGK